MESIAAAQLTGAVPPPVQPLLDPGEPGEAPGASRLRPAEEGEGVFGFLIDWGYRLLVWAATPPCLVLLAMLDWLGVPSSPVVIDFISGDVGFYLSVIDAWLPLHELISLTFSTLQVLLVWWPIRAAKRIVSFS